MVKIAKKLGFSGFKDFRSGARRLQPPADGGSPSGALARRHRPEIAQKVFRTSIHALEETLSILDPEAFERAVDLIFTARASATSTGSAARRRLPATSRTSSCASASATSVFDDAHMMLMSAALLGPGDVAVGFSHSGTTTAVIEPLELARSRGARTIAMTNYAGSPITEIADVVLCSTAQGSPLLGENAAARIAQLNILDAVFVAVAQRDLAAAEAQPREHHGRGPPRNGGADARSAQAGRRRRRQPALRHHGRRARPPAQGRDGGRLCAGGPKFGGKGGNQAVAAATRRRRDPNGGRGGRRRASARFLLAGLDAAGVDRTTVAVIDAAGSGMSVAISDAEGDYGAVIVSGANLLITRGPRRGAVSVARCAQSSCCRTRWPSDQPGRRPCGAARRRTWSA